jgi:type IX secretion system PorP/SprF family membrane protein
MTINRAHHTPAFSLAFLLLTGIASCFAQQKVQFTQYMFSGLVINPAYAGADEKLSMTFINRNQWNGLEGAPTTQTLSAHTLFKKKQFGVGFLLVNDRIGIHRNVNADVSYAYHIQTGDQSYLSMGLQAGVKSFRSDYASLNTGGTNDPYLYNVVTQQMFFDFAAGIYYRSPRLHIGFSAPELIRQQFHVNDTLSVRLNNINFFLFTRYRFTLNENFDFEPSVLVKYLKGVPLSLDVNFNWVYRRIITMGASYRKAESLDFLFKAQITPQLQVGYAYDYPVQTVSVLTTNGSHELMVQYLFSFLKKNVTSPR